MLYSYCIFSIGTEVISLIPYPLMRALREMIRPMAIFLAVDFNLTGGSVSSRVYSLV
jgi:hypothetical protein